MRVVHIADFHLPGNPEKRVNGVNPYHNLRLAVAAIKRLNPKPELIVLGGDLFEDGERGNYQLVEDCFKELQVPAHTVLGNHDHLNNFRKTASPPKTADFGGYYSFDQGDCHFVILYSAGTGKPFGRLDDRQLLWLNEDLYLNRTKPVLIFLHHPPFDTGIGWLDRIKLLNAESFWGILPPLSRNIRGVFASHLHLQYSALHRGVLVASPPAVCWQYAGNADSAKAELSEEQPGFNVLDMGPASLNLRTQRFAAAVPASGEAGRVGPG